MIDSRINTFARFAILSALANGEALRPVEIRRRLNWSPTVSGSVSFQRIINKMVRDELVARVSEVGDESKGDVRLRITRAGLQNWTEIADWVSHTMELATEAPSNNHERLEVEPDGSKRPGRKGRRVPTADEAERMRAIAGPWFLDAWEAVVAMPPTMSRESLFQLNVADVDLANGRIRINRRWIAAEPALLDVLKRAIGRRRSRGPVLRISRGNRRWQESTFNQNWRRLRERAGVPDDVVVRKKPSPKGKSSH